MKNYADLGGCYPPKSKAEADNTLLDLHNSSYHTQPHPIIAKYMYCTTIPNNASSEHSFQIFPFLGKEKPTKGRLKRNSLFI